MTIYISNYARTKDIAHYCISGSKPDWDRSIGTVSELVPPWNLIDMWNRVKHLLENDPRKQRVKATYKDLYWQQLEEVSAENLIKDGEVYCCWCAKGAFCHRYVLRDYLQEKGIEVIEI